MHNACTSPCACCVHRPRARKRWSSTRRALLSSRRKGLRSWMTQMNRCDNSGGTETKGCVCVCDKTQCFLSLTTWLHCANITGHFPAIPTRAGKAQQSQGMHSTCLLFFVSAQLYRRDVLFSKHRHRHTDTCTHTTQTQTHIHIFTTAFRFLPFRCRWQLLSGCGCKAHAADCARAPQV